MTIVSPTVPRATVKNPAEDIMGGLLITIFIACILYGMTTLQTFIYSQKYTKDGTSLKFLVYTVWVLETFHTAFCIKFIYGYLVSGFGDILNFIRVDWGVGAAVICSVLVGMCVQGYYTWRVWIVSGKAVIWTFIIAFFTLARVGFGIGSSVLSYTLPDWVRLRNLANGIATVSGGLGCAALVDLLVAMSLTFYLKRGSMWETGSFHYKQSTSMVNKILLYTVNTGALTGTASMACVIMFACKKDSLIFLGFFAIQTKLYANSFLGSLNARSHIRSTLVSRTHMFSSGSRGLQFSIPTGPVIEVTRETITHADEDREDFVARETQDLEMKAVQDLKSEALP
ncbi:hypothetical protein L226DRAFT_539322 [Lentinus tigrinus ALCF2SS1-7]|uniref:DUF6534 domain-containing protein n=1 Tax=Lentinus tigrinus ALCF2SS1-6 TaxID=1328759 RepID=A0A5C2RUG6_9APHY|nr:hypothetical protein L227DRAFT_580241 [Lentinus tigrinus ALCF2SS1-6]RPD69883.1 hypothetical protein L226DRAFT_539322 [Lentinus tigrinus ALCF2SS1-7]